MAAIAAKIAGNTAGGSPPSGSVTLGDLAPLAPFAVIGNETASSATPTAVKMNSVPGERSQATAASTTTLVNTDKGIQIFTGSTTQICKLPVVTTLIQTGWGYWIINKSTGAVTLNSSGSNLVQTIAGGASALVLANKITADTTAAAWDVVYFPPDAAIPWTSASASGPAALAFAEDTDNGTNKVTLKAPAAVTADVDAVLPDAAGTLIYRDQVPYDLACQITGAPASSAVVLRFIAPRAFTLSASGQRGTAGTAATAQTDFIVAVNGTPKATLRFAAAGVTITVVGGTAATIAAGDIITITAPGSADATLADVGLTLAGVLI